jgi:hypothetical protein
MADWGPTVAQELRNDVKFALGFKVGKKLRPLTYTERDLVAAAIVDHIKLCNWKVERGPPISRRVGHSKRFSRSRNEGRLGARSGSWRPRARVMV